VKECGYRGGGAERKSKSQRVPSSQSSNIHIWRVVCSEFASTSLEWGGQ
jgi:hypothetical protein